MNHYPVLKTNRNLFVFVLRAGCTFMLLYYVDNHRMCKDLKTITENYQSQKVYMGNFVHKRNVDIMNMELKRRGIDFQISKDASAWRSSFTALNLLSEDYNTNH